jgi:putative PEP-CTERM system TPR-repeat lipoprotein
MYKGMHTTSNILIFSLLLLLMVACSNELSEAEYLVKARNSLEEKDLKAAVINIRNVLKLNAANYQAHVMLGDIMLTSDSPALAEVEFEKLKQLGADKNLWSAGLVKSKLLQGKLDDVVGFDEGVLESKNAVDVLAYKVMAAVQRKKLDLASGLIEQADKLAIKSTELQLAKIRFFAASGKLNDAREVIDGVLVNNPEQYEALLLLGDIELNDKLFEAAENAYAKAYKSSPERFLALVQLASVQLARKDFDPAQQSINNLLKRYPEDLTVNLLQGKLLIEQGQRVKALSFIEKAANSNYSPMEAYFYAAMLHLDSNRLEQADQFSRQLLAKAPRSILATLLKANILLKQGAYKEAQDLSIKVMRTQPDNIAALNILAASLLQQGDMEGAITYYQKVVSVEPSNIEARLRLAEVLVNDGQFAEADEQVNYVLSVEGNNFSAIGVGVKSSIAQGHSDKALASIEGLKKQQQAKAFPYLLEAQLYKATHQQELVKESLQKACEVEPEEAKGCLAYAGEQVKEKAYDGALLTYESILSVQPKHLNATLGKAKLLALQEKFADMETWLLQAIAMLPDALQPKVVLGQYYLSQGKGNKAALLFSSTEKKLVSDPVFLQMLTLTQLDTKQYKKASLTVKKLLKIQPSNKQAQMLSALVQSSLGETSEAEKKLKILLKGEPNNPALKTSVAKVLYKQKKFAEAEKFLNSLPKEQAEKESVLQLRSSVALSLGNYTHATTMAKKAFDANRSSGNMLMLAQQTWREGKHDNALLLMNDWLKKHDDDIRVRTELAALYAQIGDKTKADKENEAILRQQDTNVLALNNLAWSYKDSHPAKALELASKLNDLQPGIPAFLDTLAVVQLKNGDADLASRYIEQAMAKQSAPAFVYHKAMIDAEKGDWLLAIKDLTVLLEKKDAFAERKEAEALLNKLKAGK